MKSIGAQLAFSKSTDIAAWRMKFAKAPSFSTSAGPGTAYRSRILSDSSRLSVFAKA